MLPCKPKIYFRFFLNLHLPFDTQFLTCYATGALPLEVRFENDSDRIFSKSKFVHSFLESTFLHVLCYPVIVSRKYIYGFSKSAPTPRYTISDSRLPLCNVISEGRPPFSNYGSEIFQSCSGNQFSQSFKQSC